jgi:predicted phosphodiesterase
MTVLIGIMADSHGQSEAIRAALDLFQGRNCRFIYHLGDVCDSTRPDTAAACLEPLRKHHVITLKGNNDHAIVANQIGREASPEIASVLKHLQELPLVAVFQNAVFAHSLPFDGELGLSCMIGAMGENEARRSFNQFPQHIVFRGHSHTPELLRLRHQRVESRPLGIGEKFNLNGQLPCVVTCGALTGGLCMLWDPQANLIECLSLV